MSLRGQHSLKTCTKCGATLPKTEFHPHHSTKDRLHSWCKRCHGRSNSAAHARLKEAVLSHYSDGDIKCACCEEREFRFLTIDHINRDGAKHRKSIASGNQMYYWLRRNGFPPGFQVLCWNCNLARSIYGACPHNG